MPISILLETATSTNPSLPKAPSVQPYFGPKFAFFTTLPKLWTNSLAMVQVAHWLKSAAYIMLGEGADNKIIENNSTLNGIEAMEKNKEG